MLPLREMEKPRTHHRDYEGATIVQLRPGRSTSAYLIIDPQLEAFSNDEETLEILARDGTRRVANFVPTL
jgi:hypothetical protein